MEVQQSIDRALLKIGELEAMLTDFSGNNEELHAKLNEYVACLRELQGLSGQVVCARAGVSQPIEVPLELLRYLDDGGNPDAFIGDVFRSALAQNQAAKGKVVAVRRLQEALAPRLQQISEAEGQPTTAKG